MDRRHRALLIDDDEWFARAFAAQFRVSLPRVELETRCAPDVSGDFDVYLIDNDFSGRNLAVELATAVRSTRPGVLVIAMSATLDFAVLKALINAGCNGACDKGDRAEVVRMLGVIRGFLARRGRGADRESGGLTKTISSITELLRQWNLRLDGEQGEMPAAAGPAHLART